MSNERSRADEAYMRRALSLAPRGQGRVEPNPMVGCVLVRGRQIVGEGYHRRCGGPHAEIEALRSAGRAARGATAYVTLEPCCHFGKTPPCTDALIAAGIKRVVAAMPDPFCEVDGGGIRQLRKAGIPVEIGLLEDEARRLNAPYLKQQLTGRPWVILKWAQSLDGCLATRTGESKWISGEQSRRRAHALRGRVDAVIVGVGTVLADDPELTCRLVRPQRIATRIVLDPHLRTPPRCKLARTARKVPTLIATLADSAESRQAKTLRAGGVELLALPGTTKRASHPGDRGKRGLAPSATALVMRETASREVPVPFCQGAAGEQVSRLGGRASCRPVLQRRIPARRDETCHSAGCGLDLAKLLQILGKRGMTNVMVEGGGITLGSFYDAGLADEAVIFVAHRLIGGQAAPHALDASGPTLIRETKSPLITEVTRSGQDNLYRLVFTDMTQL